MFRMVFCLNISPPHWKFKSTNIVIHALSGVPAETFHALPFGPFHCQLFFILKVEGEH